MTDENRSSGAVARPVVERKRGPSSIWLLPLIALGIGGWLMYKSLTEAGIEIYITFDSAEGIEEGKTRIMYKGLTGGVVKKIRIDDDLETVTVMAEMIPDARNGLRENSVFWLVKPKVSFSGVSGLDTLVSGNYIALRPGDGDFETHFLALTKAPPLDQSSAGLHLTLMAKELGSVDRGSQVFYREIPVGDVQDYELDELSGGVKIRIHIHEEYAHLVKKGSRFWNASGLRLNASLGTGLELEMQSLSSLIAGGIAFYTPGRASESHAENGDQFPLHGNYSEAEAGITASIVFSDGKGLQEGRTQVLYNNLVVGQLKKLDYDERFQTVRAEILFDPDAAKLLREDSKFWIVRPHISFAGLSDLNRLVSGAYIAMQPGQGKSQRNFKGLADAPVIQDLPGMTLHLVADELGSVEVGSPVLFKKIRIGEVRDYRLSPDGGRVDITLSIESKYESLVRPDSRFWNSSGIRFKAGPDGFSMQMGSASSVLTGGISLFNAVGVSGRKAKDGSKYRLYASYDAVTEQGKLLYDAHSPGLHLKLLVERLGSLVAGSPILYKQVPVGEIKGYRLDPDTDMIIVNAHIRAPYDKLVTDKTRFWNASGVAIDASLNGLRLQAESLTTLVQGGVAFEQPDGVTGSRVTPGQEFRLYPDRDRALRDTVLIRLYFRSAEAISVGTPVRYRGLKVGAIRNISLAADNRGVLAEVDLYQTGHQLAREDSRFWLVGPEVSLTRADNLDTLLTGGYITVRPGRGAFATEFDASGDPPLQRSLDRGLNLILVAGQRGSLKAGTGVYYRQIRVGQVVNTALGPEADNVLIYINIDERYAPLVHAGTRFWNVSGVNMNLGIFSGLTVKTESVETLVGGGIAMATPEGSEMGARITAGRQFVLHETPEDEWLAWQPKIKLPQH